MIQGILWKGSVEQQPFYVAIYWSLLVFSKNIDFLLVPDVL